MKEIEFYFDFENGKIFFSDGNKIDIDLEKERFIYKEKEFYLESDVEKDLCNTFDFRYVNIGI